MLTFVYVGANDAATLTSARHVYATQTVFLPPKDFRAEPIHTDAQRHRHRIISKGTRTQTTTTDCLFVCILTHYLIIGSRSLQGPTTATTISSEAKICCILLCAIRQRHCITARPHHRRKYFQHPSDVINFAMRSRCDSMTALQQQQQQPAGCSSTN